MRHLLPLNESESLYRREVKVSVTYTGSAFKGKEIDYIYDTKIDVSFRIDIEARSWGIKGISLYDVNGPSELDLTIVYYPNEEDLLSDSVDETVTVKLDWKNVQIEEVEEMGVLTVDSIDLEMTNDEEGGLLAVPGGRLIAGGNLQVGKIIANVYKF